MNRRLGKFYIHESILETSPSEMKAVMGECLILKCEFNYASKCFEYQACCDLFDELPIGQQLPTYKFEYTGSGIIGVTKND